MSVTYSLILRACPEGSRDAVAQVLGRAFSLKDSTCSSIASSTPIVLLGALTRDEAAALSLPMSQLQQKGATIEFTTADVDDLPKIDWPRRPMVFKREIPDHVTDCQMQLPVPGNPKTYSLLELLTLRLSPGGSRPSTVAVGKPNEFRGSTLPEITPFSNLALPPTPTPAPAPAPRPAPAPAEAGQDVDAAARLNELFPEEESGFMPNNDDITSILDRLLPDEEQARAAPGPASQSGQAGHSSGASSGRIAAVAGPGYSVFLAKITDDARRAKVVAILEELAKLSHEDADALSKKVIIPVLKGVGKDEAEAAKARFAKIGILARVKGPDG